MEHRKRQSAKSMGGFNVMSAPIQFPQSTESEQAILGYVLMNGRDGINAALSVFRPEWFFKPAHRLIWDACLRVDQATDYWDCSAVVAKAIDSGTLADMGGAAEVVGLTSQAALSPEHVAFYAEIAEAKWRQREVLKATQALQSACLGDADDFAGEMEIFHNAVSAVWRDAGGRDLVRVGVDIIPDIMAEFLAAYEGREANPEHRNWPATGIAEIDTHIGGLVRDNWVIGAETSGGKTAMMLQLACSALAAGQNVLIFSLEMEAEMLVKRMLSCAGSIPMKNIIEKAFSDMEFGRLTSASNELGSPKLLICDQPMTVAEIASVAKAQHARRPIDFLGVDYIQIVVPESRKGESRQQELGRISQGLKRLQRELGCMSVCPTQLNDDGKVREARDIIMDAAIGLRIQPDGIQVMKNRNGPRGILLNLWLNGAYQRFESAQQPKTVRQ